MKKPVSKSDEDRIGQIVEFVAPKRTRAKNCTFQLKDPPKIADQKSRNK